MNSLVELKTIIDNFEVEYEVNYLSNLYCSQESSHIINNKISEINKQIEEKEKILKNYNNQIHVLMSHADGVDYLFAVVSGMISGFLDVFFVENLSLEKANSWGNEEIKKFVLKVAKKKGYKGSSVGDAVEYLEKENPIAADKATSFFGGGKQHHLRDFSHHPTPLGLFFSILTQFTQKVYGTDTNGNFVSFELNKDNSYLIGKNAQEKIFFGVIKWMLHLVSDVAGSSGSIRKGSTGTGIPGFFLGMLKEVSSLSIFKNSDTKKQLSLYISKLFNGTLLGKRDENGKLVPLKFDLRTEIGIYHHLNKSTTPILINECIVKGFYFFRRLFNEIRINNINNIQDLHSVEWENVLPFKNRTIIRMITISQGVMSTIDVTDAIIESIIKSGTNPTVILNNAIISINFVGIGRIAFSLSSDISMGSKEKKYKRKKINEMNQYLFLLNGKFYCKEAGIWHEIEKNKKVISEIINRLQQSNTFYNYSINEIGNNLNKIKKYSSDINQKNEGLLEELIDILE